MRNEVVEELIPDLEGKRHTEPNVGLRKSGRNRGIRSKKGGEGEKNRAKADQTLLSLAATFPF